MNKPVHIVCLDAPSPPDYGGAIDMYYKIKALAETGASVTLHYFDYKKGRHADGLKQYCEQVYAYKRKSYLETPTFSKPHIVASRINQKLIKRLNADSYPVILEGLHCAGLIPFLKNENRKIVVRLHNDEAVYYNHLAATETNFFKSSYYAWESLLLKRYQKTLPAAACYAALSQKDADRFRKEYKLTNVSFIPAFVPWNEVTSLSGSGAYCLYHGNLSVAENEAAALWLIQTVFSKLNFPFVIAGKNIAGRLKKAAAPFQHITLKPEPTDSELAGLIEKAHINVLPDFNATGVKLKVLHALFCGRFCITNNREMSSDTVACAQTATEYMGFIKSFTDKNFTAAHLPERKKALHLYNNAENVQLLSAHLW